MLREEYDGRLTNLAADAKSIRDTVTNADEVSVAKLPPAEPYEGEEGNIVMRLYDDTNATLSLQRRCVRRRLQRVG